MKNIKKLIVATSLFIGSLGFAQAPEKMSYQAVVRNTTNNLLVSQNVGMQISILQGSATGTAVYVETQTPTSNTNGLVTLEIGGGTVVSGNFTTINWANGPYFIKTETDPAGGTSYTITGTSQLLSTPYALYAKTSGSSTPGPQGPAGATGPSGTNGLDGATGPMGPQGIQGLTGPAGPAGANGTNGLDGATGPMGPQGPQGLTGPTGATGPIGPQGPAGPKGLQGAPGANGQGVPTGGTANQVLAKVDGVDFNTQWVTPSASVSVYPNVELYVSNTSIQNIPDLLGGAGSTLLTFSATNNTNASLTGGNTWNGSVFTVGTAGWYEIDVQIVGVTNAGGLSSNGVDFFMDKNNTVGASKTGALYRNVRNSQPSETILKNNSTLHTTIFLNAGDNIRFRGFAWSNTLAANSSADGSTFLNIVRIK